MAEDQKVVALPGFSVPVGKGEPVKGVVDILREYLMKAEAGEVRAVAIAVVIDDGTPSTMIFTDFTASAGTGWDLFAALGRLNRRFEKYLDES